MHHTVAFHVSAISGHPKFHDRGVVLTINGARFLSPCKQSLEGCIGITLSVFLVSKTSPKLMN